MIKTASFVKSSSLVSECPKPDKPEYAFIGRSNVGKSSLINMLTNQKKLAKISAQPGKTQTINHFIINDAWYLVDLPGYGYAKASKKNRATWNKVTREYALKRQDLTAFFVLIDSRLAPQSIDLEFLEFLGIHSIPFVIVFTKADKKGKIKTEDSVEAFKAKILEKWEVLPPFFVSSAEKGTGKDEIIAYIEEINESF